MSQSKVRRFLLIVLLLTAGRGSSHAQGTTTGLGSTTGPVGSGASYYYVGRPGELTMEINVLGFVQKPGRYEVAGSTDLLQLLAYAGGATADGDLSEVRVTRFVTAASVVTKQEYTINIEHLDRGEMARLSLLPGDTIYVGHTSWFILRDIFAVVTAAALVTTAVAQIVIAKKQ